MMNIQLLMITHNRPEYTRISLGALLESVPPAVQVTVWDNASDAPTKAVLAEFSSHPRMREVVYCKTNQKLREPTNWFWTRQREADYVGKIDDDCLHQPGWCEALLEVHENFPRAGIVGTWRFYPEDTLEVIPRSKIVRAGGVGLMRNCWVQGSGYLMRTRVIDALGLLGPKESFPRYCIRAASKGFVNGFAHPFIFEDHFDDPRSVHSQIKTDEDLQRMLPLSAQSFGISTVRQWTDHQKNEAAILQRAAFHPWLHAGPLSRLLRMGHRLLGQSYQPIAR